MAFIVAERYITDARTILILPRLFRWAYYCLLMSRRSRLRQGNAQERVFRMIYESAPWKAQLLKDADIIERWSEKPAANQRRSTLIKKKIFVSAYAIRKLFEAEKLSSDLNSYSVQAEQFTLLPGRKLTWWKTHKFDEIFNLAAPTSLSVSARNLLDTIIHSKVFSECVFSECDLRISGFFVTSEHRDHHLWLVPIECYTKLMRRVGNDYPSVISMAFNPITGEHLSWRGHGDPPRPFATKMTRFSSEVASKAQDMK